ncbi:MAG: hypothetical protein GTO26_02670 [Planctomycetales bacterium]|nr:hypothetical protein [Planctomycetales bacterium]NIO33897.1 hypothetical protein [Planctomycetales bacterium]NIO45705.1 hypothetical protein [Planctomycetales bacterium]NIP84543.1 hypothetical protein [Planctomycetales bacterium]
MYWTPAKRTVGWAGLLSLLAVGCGGCRVVQAERNQADSPLVPLQKSSQQIEVDVVFVRVPDAATRTVEQLWEDVDEQAIGAEQRRRLGKNGFRAGVVGTQLPDPLAEIVSQASSIEGDGSVQFGTADAEELGVTRRRMFLQRGQHGELVSAPVQAELQVLYVNQSELQGDTFHDVQPQFSLQAEQTGDGRVELTLVPELHFGEYRQRYVPGEGMFRLDSSRDKKVYERLQIAAPLSPGQVLLLGAQGARSGSLGYQFFTDTSSTPSGSKLLLIRVSENSFGSIYDPLASTPAE